MHSDGNSLGGDVILDGFNMAYKDEDNILDQIYVWKENLFGLSFWKFKIFRMIKENWYLKKYSIIQQGTHKIKF